MSESDRGTSPIRLNQPARQVMATFDDYADAESAVDYLSDQHSTVDDELAVVGRDIELAEQVVGRLNYGWAALRGAAAGALTAHCSAGSSDYSTGSSRCSSASCSPATGWCSALLSASCSAYSCTRCGAVGATSPQSSHYNHVTTKSLPTSRSRTKPFACSPAGPIERNESWRPL